MPAPEASGDGSGETAAAGDAPAAGEGCAGAGCC